MSYTCEIHILRDFSKTLGAMGLSKFGEPVTDPKEFDLAYTLTLEPTGDVDALDTCFYIFNIEHPEDYRNRSLSVGDVVVLNSPAGRRAYLCKSVGWQEIDFPAAVMQS